MKASKQSARASFMASYVGCHQKVWSRFRVGFPTLDDKITQTPYSCAQLCLGSTWLQMWSRRIPILAITSREFSRLFSLSSTPQVEELSKKLTEYDQASKVQQQKLKVGLWLPQNKLSSWAVVVWGQSRSTLGAWLPRKSSWSQKPCLCLLGTLTERPYLSIMNTYAFQLD